MRSITARSRVSRFTVSGLGDMRSRTVNIFIALPETSGGRPGHSGSIYSLAEVEHS